MHTATFYGRRLGERFSTKDQNALQNGVAFLCSSDAATVWRRAEFGVRLPRDTIVMVDLCTAYRKSNKGDKPQQYHVARIIDAITLCGNSVRELPFEQRHVICYC